MEVVAGVEDHYLCYVQDIVAQSFVAGVQQCSVSKAVIEVAAEEVVAAVENCDQQSC